MLEIKTPPFRNNFDGTWNAKLPFWQTARITRLESGGFIVSVSTGKDGWTTVAAAGTLKQAKAKFAKEFQSQIKQLIVGSAVTSFPVLDLANKITELVAKMSENKPALTLLGQESIFLSNEVLVLAKNVIGNKEDEGFED